MLRTNRDRLIADCKTQHVDQLRRQKNSLRAAEVQKAQANADRLAEVQSQDEERIRMAEEVAARAIERTRRRPETLTPPPSMGSVDAMKHAPEASVYDRPPRKCVFCGQITADWWTNVGAEGCKCKTCLRAGRS